MHVTTRRRAGLTHASGLLLAALLPLGIGCAHRATPQPHGNTEEATQQPTTPASCSHHRRGKPCATCKAHQQHSPCRAHKQPYRHHHGGAHRFEDAEKWARTFETPERDAWQKPAIVLAKLSLDPAMRVADIGAATGYFTVRLARAVPQGDVWGVDIEPNMVAYLAKRAKREGLANLHAVQGSSTSPTLPETVDLVFVCNTYHHIPDRPAYFRQLKNQLNPDGRVAIVDFRMGDIPVGPPEHARVSPHQLQGELTAAGYRRLLLDTDTLPYQYIAIYAR